MPDYVRRIGVLAAVFLPVTLAACADNGGATPPGFTPAAATAPTSGAGPGKSARPQGGG